VATDIVARRAARQLDATLDPVQLGDVLDEGAVLPPLWHWWSGNPQGLQWRD